MRACTVGLLGLLLAWPAAAQHKGSPNLEPQLRQRRDIIFFCDFEAKDWHRDWGIAAPPFTVAAVAADEPLKFQPFQGQALRVHIFKGQNSALGISFFFKKELGEEPEAAYFRYYLRLADDWKDHADGGKLPGFAGTYNRAGWGGRPADGKNGWSARGSFRRFQNGKNPIGFYCYHADQKGKYGHHWVWEKDKLGYLDNNRWYCVEQFVQLNTPGRDGQPGKNDGVLRGWIDGQLAFEKTDIRFRDLDTLKVERVWLNVYHGGLAPAKFDHHLFIDNVVIARNYIGPMPQPK